jgi:hypothetical protein
MLKIARIFAYTGYMHVATVHKTGGFIRLLNYPKIIQQQIPNFEVSAFCKFLNASFVILNN